MRAALQLCELHNMYKIWLFYSPAWYSASMECVHLYKIKFLVTLIVQIIII